MPNCKDCKHWCQPAPGDKTGEKFRGCLVWNKYKHLGQRPHKAAACDVCGRGDEADFESDLYLMGPDVPYEGWVGKGRLTNFSIITEASDSCKFFKPKEVKDV